MDTLDLSTEEIEDPVVHSDSDDELLQKDESDCSEESDGEQQPSTSGSEDLPPEPRSRKNYSWIPAGRRPKLEPFLGNPGPTSEVDQKDPVSFLDYFQLVVTDEFLEKVVTETNKYAEQFFSARARSSDQSSTDQSSTDQSYLTNWKELTLREFKAFLGLTLLTGIIDKKGKAAEYWTTRDSLSTPYFGKVMARNRYQMIQKFLHFNDNARRPENCTDRLYKIRPVLNELISNWKKTYNLGENISIDEGMLKWRGRLSFKVYIKDKPTKYGIKSYILADSVTGYCYSLEVYCGERKRLKQTVTDLLGADCLYKWHSLFMDNYYNSVELSEALLDRQVHTVGTIRSHSGEPAVIREAKTVKDKLKPGEIIARDNGRVTVLAWRDKRVVTALTTKHDARSSCVVRRKKHGPDMEEVLKPDCIIEYNKYMCGVDRLDQMISYYPMMRKTLKWPKKVFQYGIEISLWNTFIILQAKLGHSFVTLRSYRLKVLEELCQTPLDDEQTGTSDPQTTTDLRSPRYDPCSRLKGGLYRHKLVPYKSTARKKYPVRRCRVCARKGIRKETRMKCEDCKVPLCKQNCFNLYHTKA